MPLDSTDIQELAKALQTVASASPAPTHVNAAAIKLPEFWSDDPELWFARVEAQFATRGIKDQDTRFNYVAAALDNSSAGEVKSILLHPPADKYDMLKAALIDAFAKSQAQKDAELLAISGLGDRKPTALLRKIQALNSNTDTLLRAFFLAQLPSDVRAMLAASDITDIEELAKAADRIVESKDITQHGYVSEVSRVRDRRRDRDNASKTSNTSVFICYFHGKFGTKARSCRPGCLFADLRPSTEEDLSKSFPKKSTAGNEQAGR